MSEYSTIVAFKERFSRTPMQYEVMSLAEKRGLLSRNHFSVDCAQAWASHKSFRAKDGSDDGPSASGGRNADTD